MTGLAVPQSGDRHSNTMVASVNVSPSKRPSTPLLQHALYHGPDISTTFDTWSFVTRHFGKSGLQGPEYGGRLSRPIQRSDLARSFSSSWGLRATISKPGEVPPSKSNYRFIWCASTCFQKARTDPSCVPPISAPKDVACQTCSLAVSLTRVITATNLLISPSILSLSLSCSLLAQEARLKLNHRNSR